MSKYRFLTAGSTVILANNITAISRPPSGVVLTPFQPTKLAAKKKVKITSISSDARYTFRAFFNNSFLMLQILNHIGSLLQ